MTIHVHIITSTLALCKTIFTYFHDEKNEHLPWVICDENDICEDNSLILTKNNNFYKK